LSTRYLIKPSDYHDSVTLMETARELSQLSGVADAAVVMATEANKGILQEAGMLLPEITTATANDLVVVVRAASDATAKHALKVAEEHLARRPEAGGAGPAFQPRTIRGAVRATPEANLALISVAGQYAVAEAWEALRSGLHVLLFSDNVPIEDEVALKQYAVERGLLMMGPDCGTAIINGVALGFANVVPHGPIGIVAASGTGLQEISSLLAKLDVGITQGIGTGGRDLKEQVGGIMMLEGLKALQRDPETKVLLLVSKPPSPAIAERVLEQVRENHKPTVVCFLGGDPAAAAGGGAIPARTLQEVAYLAAAEVGGYEGPSADELIEQEIADLKAQAVDLRRTLEPGQIYLRGLFSGGTLAAEALVVWEEILGDVRSNNLLEADVADADAQTVGSGRCVRSNNPLEADVADRSGRFVRSNVAVGTRNQGSQKPGFAEKTRFLREGHCAVDLGEDEFTVGRPHPMIDNDLRIRRLMQEASDPEVAVIVLDVVLGYGAHPDPASELGPAIRQARARAAEGRRELIVVASVTGTEGDPQGLNRQVQALEEAGAIVCASNATAARLAGFIVA
jgi:FdrA protein